MTDTMYRLPVCDTAKSAKDKISGSKGSFWAFIGILFLIGIGLAIFVAVTGLDHITRLLQSLIQFIAGGCFIYLGIRRAQGQTLQWTMVKNVLNVKTCLNLIGVGLLQLLAYLPIGIVTVVAIIIKTANPDSESGFGIWIILGIIALVITAYFLLRLYLAMGLVVDKRLNAWRAVLASFKATKGNVWNLIGIYIINLIVIVLCVITLGIGFIWGLPFIMVLYGEAYVRLTSAHPEIDVMQ